MALTKNSDLRSVGALLAVEPEWGSSLVADPEDLRLVAQSEERDAESLFVLEILQEIEVLHLHQRTHTHSNKRTHTENSQ